MSAVPPASPADEAVEQLLRDAAPAAPTAFRHELERSLLPQGGGLARRRWQLVAGASGLCAVVLGAALIGGGPLAADGGDAARAGSHCRTVYVTRAEPLGQVRREADGSVRVQTVKQPVTRAERRCR